jgi:asparagine synthase (glutamine-hydrolysing)
MCGFLGFVGSNVIDIEQNFKNAFETINHRGPDSSEIYQSEKYLLGFKRLAIIDLERRSNQPYSDGKNFLLFNGEIYNYKNLKQNLITDFGCHFTTTGDTEVLFNGLKYKGEEFLKEIDGMFALCFISDAGEILLARDRFGQKPLFYNIDQNNNLVFGSELGSIIKFLGKHSLEVNENTFSSYFQYGASVAPNTFFKDLMQVVPGKFIRFNSQLENITKENWDEISPAKHTKIPLKQALINRLKTCFVSDTPIALLSSGGIDSSALVKTARYVTSSVPILAVHLNTQEDGKGLIIAKKMETSELPLMIINSGNISNKNTNELIDILLRRFGEPFSDTSYIYSEELYSSIPKKYKVIIGGDGADEVFKGYKPAALFFVSSVVSKLIPLKIRRKWISKSKPFNKFGLILRILIGCQESMEQLLMGFGSDQISSMTSNKSNADNQKIFRILTGTEIKLFYYHYLDIRLKNVFMRKADHASMKHSKELRSPYLQNNPDEFTKINNIFGYLIPKLNLKLYLLGAIDFFGVFRKKIGFDMGSTDDKVSRKEDLLLWCNHNRSLVESYFLFDEFISLIKSIKKDSHIFRIEVFLAWVQGFHGQK